MRIQTVSVLALCMALTACANPQVPDFMVKGELPFGGDKAEPVTAVAQPEPQAQPKARKDRKADTPQTAVAAAPAPVVAQNAPAPAPVKPAPVKPEPAPQVAVSPPAAQPAPAVISPRPQAAPTRPEARPDAPLVGGFQPARDKNKVKAVAAFAADAAPIGYLLKGVESARTQVVAGTNYELCLEVRRAFRETSGWRTRLAKAEVYEDLSGNLTLMTWEEVKTCP